jgi:hypothetical protein
MCHKLIIFIKIMVNHHEQVMAQQKLMCMVKVDWIIKKIIP